LDPNGSAISEAPATPPCDFISIRSLVKIADGDPANDMCRFSDLIEHADRTGVRIINLSMGSNSAEDWE
tara:strand:- start:1456 stop:1662 length:207 start_codon:yes stop_codon:yes gene_type:complete